MEQFDSSVEESSEVSEQQQRNDEQQCPRCAAELTEAGVTEENFLGQLEQDLVKQTTFMQQSCMNTICKNLNPTCSQLSYHNLNNKPK